MKMPLAALVTLTLALPSSSRAQNYLEPAIPAPPRKALPQLPARYSAVIQFEKPLDIQRRDSLKVEHVNAVPLELKPGDRLRTGRRGAARLLLKDLSEIRLGPNSEFMLAEESKTSMLMSLMRGHLWAQVRKDKARRFSVSNPVAICSVRGTEFSVSYDGYSSVTEVRSGLVAVQALVWGVPSGPEALVPAGRRVRVSQGRVGPLEIIEARLPQDPAMPLPALAWQEAPLQTDAQILGGEVPLVSNDLQGAAAVQIFSSASQQLSNPAQNTSSAAASLPQNGPVTPPNLLH